jgi:glycosyltransferase involved in cell wall biosynthesis
MACGAAVLTTPLLAIPEVGGDAVEYVESTPEGIESGLVDLLTSPARRAELSAAAAQRAAAFTWAASAEAHLRTFAHAVAG